MAGRNENMLRRHEAGASALIIASSLILLIGMAAVAIDVGAGFNERRQNQSAADMAALAGAIDFSSGPVAMRDQALNYVAGNITNQFSASDWQALWTACTDPNKNAGTFNFQPVPSPWTAGTLDCISVDASGYLRVRVPDQLQDTAFAVVLGVSELTTNASAIAQVTSSGRGDVLPFAVLGGPQGSHYCLRTQPGAGNPGGGNPGGGNPGGGNSPPDPCSGNDGSEFGTIDSPLFGNPDPRLQTDAVCGVGGPQHLSVLATNIALGLDHPVFARETSPQVEDRCGEVGVNALDTDQGMGQGTEQGLINGSGTFPSGHFRSPVAVPRLQLGPYATRSVKGVAIDDKPLWEFLLDDGEPLGSGITLVYGVNAPITCDPDGFDGGTFDWDGDGTGDPNRSWQHMGVCLDDYQNGSGFVQIFDANIASTPRFAFVPQFIEDEFQGPAFWYDIERFRAVYIQGLWFGSSNSNQVAFHPGEGSGPVNTNLGLSQVSGFLIPDGALPAELRANPLPSVGSIFDIILFR